MFNCLFKKKLGCDLRKDFHTEIEQLKKLQFESIKKANELQELSRKKFQEIQSKDLALPEKKTMGIVLVNVLIILLGIALTCFLRKRRKEQRIQESNEYVYQESAENENFDFESASLEELEKALLELENEISGIENSIDALHNKK